MRCVLNWPLAVVVSLGLLGCASQGKEVIPAERAREHLGRACTVEMTVRSSKHEVEKHIFYLDSENDYMDKKNLAVVIAEADLERFRPLKIDDPAAHYKGKRIRVTGKVVFTDDQYQIWVKSPAEIEVLETGE